jgi:hypothetical protein
VAWSNPPRGTASVVFADPEFGNENRVLAITVVCLDAERQVIHEERVQFPPEPYCATYDMLLAARDKINAGLRKRS